MNPNAPVPVGNAEADAAYIASMTRELAAMARRHGFNALGYLLDMANLEAGNCAKQSGAGGIDQPNATRPPA
jgi:hypothetical protein